ncbi:glutaminyl-peptide cyclotransferase [Parasteatoda tepidariorum]|uniref:glutaminyl-peptide cyclotransferase n=1 Tax=Parasteatoda tepidariorum TaxID=114398 RepID=UPI00077FA5E4|nr:glutaminyl-peptide cyclotransferase [Parasteatoda tepidariorum]
MPSIAQLLFFPIPALFFMWMLNSLSKTGLTVRGVSWSKDATKWPHTLSRLQNNDLDHVVSKASCFKHFNKTLDTILIPRVPGTEGHKLVREFIVDEMKQLGWTVEEDTFTDRTPHGRKSFSNIIANLNPDACRHLTLACHYDSLYNREYTFMGATDSAVPCAMLIHAAKMLHMPLKQKSEKDYELSLQFIFFDGEEAFKRWSKTDSLYGSRHLAEKWNKMKAFPTGLNSGSHCTKKEYVSYLDRMDVMVLLDLIGTANPKFYSYFPDTYGLYSQLIEIEKRLNSLGLLDAEPPRSETHYFDSRTILAYVEDDHVPFMRLGVPILHLIPNPFPSVWHRESDNRDSLHHATIDNLNKILRVFIAEYLHLFTQKEVDIM